ALALPAARAAAPAQNRFSRVLNYAGLPAAPQVRRLVMPKSRRRRKSSQKRVLFSAFRSNITCRAVAEAKVGTSDIKHQWLAAISPLPFSFCLFLSQPRHVDHEPIFDVALQHPLIIFVDLLHWNDLALACDSAIGAEIEHLLRLGDPPNQRADKAPASPDETHYTNRLGFRRDPFQSQRPVTFQ